MNSKNLKGLCEAYDGVYAPQELTEEQVWEEVERWVSSLIEEGYDLSEYSWEEMYEAYLEEKDVVQLPGGKSATTGRGYSATLGGQPGQLTYQRTPGSTNRVQRTFKANPVLSVKGGVKGTGVGKDFKAQPWSSAATARYDKQSVENKRNASKALVTATNKNPNIKPDPNSRSTGSEVNPPSQASPRPTTPTATRRPSVASSPRPAATPAAKPKPAAPTGPAVGKLGSTSFERRTPTSAELKAAQAARAGGASPEKALQAAQKTNLPTTGSPTVPASGSINVGLASFKPRDMTKNPLKPTPPTTMKNSYEWGSTSKLVNDIAGLYQSVYEAKKVDQDKDGDNDFADVRIARLIASGVSKEEAIRRVRDKSYNEEVEIDEATRMRKELGKEGEIGVRKELAARSKGFKRSGSVDKTIAAAEREADRTTARNRDETSDDYKSRMQNRSKTLRGLAANRRKSVRSGEGLRGYAAKVEGDEKDLQSARGSARSAGTLTPAEKKGLGEEFDLWVNALIYEGYDLSEYTLDEMIEIYEETEEERKRNDRRARVAELQAQGRVMTSSKRASQKAAQRKQDKKEEMADRLLRSIQASGSTRSSSTPMGTTEPEEKPEAPAANRRLGGKVKKDDLASQANAILRTIKNENIQLWVNELINEGYDLNGWTGKEITKLYFEIFE